MPHLLNWYAGWSFLLASFLIGALLGLRFYRDSFLGGYASWPRRMLRLGHIALAALGILNMAFALAPIPAPASWQATGATWGLLLGGATMPLVCFLAAWKLPFRHLFPIPVTALLIATLCVLAA